MSDPFPEMSNAQKGFEFHKQMDFFGRGVLNFGPFCELFVAYLLNAKTGIFFPKIYKCRVTLE